MTYDRIVTGGLVVTADGVTEADIGIRGETIAAIGQGLPRDGADVVDATGHYVLPGILDVHVHLALPFCGTTSADDYYTCSR